MIDYPKKNLEFAVIATDVVIFTVQNGELKVLLIAMNKDPFKGSWAIPGGLVKPDESVDDAAKRHLLNKAGLKDVYLEQLYTFGAVDRDPYGRVVSVSYFALIPSAGLEVKTSNEYKGIDWFNVKDLPKLAYDHKEIMHFAVQRLQNKLNYTNIIFSLLAKEFTLGELQKYYEIILDRKIDKRNFRKKILALKILKKHAKKKKGAYRPAVLYSFTHRKPEDIEMI